MTPFTFIIKRKAYALAALVALTCAGLASCTDDNLVNNNGGGEKVNPADAKLATTTVTFSAGAGMQLPNITRAMNPDAPATRAVSVNKYMPLAEGSNLTARIFVVKADESSMTTINGKKAMDPEKVIMGAGEVKWDNIQQIDGGGVSLRSNEDLLTLTWLNKSALIKPGEDWYICGIIGGDYEEDFKKAADQETKNMANKLLMNQLYNFYVKFNPSKDHNTRDAKGNLRVTAAFSTGWTKLDVKKTNVINLHRWAFKARGSLIRFKVKRDPQLVKPEAHKYTFASSQLTANGGFLMMPLKGFRLPETYSKDCAMGLDCEIRPWEQDIDHNFYWQYQGDNRLHFNNVTDTDPAKEDASYGTPIYEYRYTYDAGKMHDDKYGKDYDEFYVWGMPIPLPNYNGTTQLTAERGSFMLGQKQPQGAKYPYADEWLYAKAVKAETNSNEYKLIDFSQQRGKGFTAEVGVCRPRFSTVEKGGKLKYAWPNPLERLAVTNSMTAQKGWHETNTQHSSTSDWGNVANWSIKQADLKFNFVVGDKTCLPDNYHVPNGEEWGAVVPNILNSIYDCYLVPNLLGWDYIKPGATPWLEMYNVGKDDMRPIITGGETHNTNKTPILEELYWKDFPKYYSYFMQNKEMGEMFAIRFNGQNKEAKYKEDKYTMGQRYRCAYRWRLVNMGGPAGSNDDVECMRLVVQSRWIGSANVTLRDLTDEKWWGESSPDNPLFNTDCYRVLPCAGYPHTNGRYQWYLNYWSRTRWKAINAEDNYYSNKTFCYRRIGKDGFDRGHNDNQRGYFPVRLFVNRDVDEFGNEAPRRKQHDKDQTLLISRKADEKVTNWTWTPKN